MISEARRTISDFFFLGVPGRHVFRVEQAFCELKYATINTVGRYRVVQAALLAWDEEGWRGGSRELGIPRIAHEYFRKLYKVNVFIGYRRINDLASFMSMLRQQRGRWRWGLDATLTGVRSYRYMNSLHRVYHRVVVIHFPHPPRSTCSIRTQTG